MPIDGINCKGIYFGEVLSQIRNQRGISLLHLGDLVGYSTSNLHRWESNQAIPPQFEIVEMLCESMFCSAAEKVILEEAYLCSVLRQRGICE